MLSSLGGTARVFLFLERKRNRKRTLWQNFVLPLKKSAEKMDKHLQKNLQFRYEWCIMFVRSKIAGFREAQRTKPAGVVACPAVRPGAQPRPGTGEGKAKRDNCGPRYPSKL